MAINTNKYDGVHYQVVLMNMKDGSVQGHAAGCADLKRGVHKFAEPYQAEDGLWDVETKIDAWYAYNADFFAECYEHENCDETKGICANAYDIKWLPCANHVPAEPEVEETNDEVIVLDEPKKTDVEVKRGRKWTYIFVNGEQVMEVRTELADQVLATINFG